MKSKSPTKQLQVRARAQLNMLAAQFLIGMAVNLIGFPSETSGFAQVTTATLTGIHVLIAFGLVVGSILTLKLLKKYAPQHLRTGWFGFWAIIFTFVTGMFTMAYENNWWSYAMAVGFFASAWVYGALYFRVADKSTDKVA